MTERKAESEPSMEEILSSIRRIISEGGDSADKEAAKGPRPETQEEVLDLTEMVEDDGTVVSLADHNKGKPEIRPQAEIKVQPEMEPEPEIESAPPSTAQPEAEIRAEPPAAPADAPMAAAFPRPSSPPPAAARREEGLVSSEPAQATAAALANLAASVSHEIEASAQVAIGAPGRTLEDIVKDLLRPMIQNWLDANLPAITERLVRREIQRIANRVDTD